MFAGFPNQSLLLTMIKPPSCSGEEGIECLLASLLLISSERNSSTPVFRSCRRLTRSTGWLENALNNYSVARFKETFRVSGSTLRYTVYIKSHWTISS